MQRAALACLLSISLAGCIVSVEFDPVGTAASMEATWTVQGAPATEDSCGEIRFVRIRFFDGDEHRDHPDLVFDCAAGGFDTRPERLVASGAWTVAPIAIRPDGSEVDRGPTVSLDTSIVGGGHLVIEPFDLDLD